MSEKQGVFLLLIWQYFGLSHSNTMIYRKYMWSLLEVCWDSFCHHCYRRKLHVPLAETKTPESAKREQFCGERKRWS